MYDAEHIATLHSRVAGPKALGKCQPWILLHPQKPHFQGSDLDILEGKDMTEITGFLVFKDQGGKNKQEKKIPFTKKPQHPSVRREKLQKVRE